MVSNNSILELTDIGDIDSSGTPLVCATQLTPCCAAFENRHGEWFYPNGTRIPIMGANYPFYRIRRDAQTGVLGGALLNRRFDAMAPNGIYRCVIPGTDRVSQTLYVGLYTNSKYIIIMLLCLSYASH